MIESALFYKDPYCFSFSSAVLSCKRIADSSYEVVLESSFFYPTGGGQPCDRGNIGNSKVTDVIERSSEIIHVVDKPLEPGKMYDCVIDKEYRLTFMRSHSGEHIFTGHLHGITGADNIGFHMNEELITVDFNREVDEEILASVEEKTNRTILENKEIICRFPSESELHNINFRQKKELSGPVRLVEIPDVDICACCGIHVARSSEIGIVKVVSYQKYKTGCRIQLAAGFPAMKLFFDGYRQLQTVSGQTSKPVLEVSEGVDALKESLNSLKSEISELKKRYLSLAADNYETVDGFTFACAEDCTPADLITLCNFLKEYSGSVFALSQSGENKSYICIASDDNGINTLIDKISGSYSVKGGGRNGIFQGWVQASVEQIRNMM